MNEWGMCNQLKNRSNEFEDSMFIWRFIYRNMTFRLESLIRIDLY